MQQCRALVFFRYFHVLSRDEWHLKNNNNNSLSCTFFVSVMMNLKNARDDLTRKKKTIFFLQRAETSEGVRYVQEGEENKSRSNGNLLPTCCPF